jgi:hypothetical protein
MEAKVMEGKRRKNSDDDKEDVKDYNEDDKEKITEIETRNNRRWR